MLQMCINTSSYAQIDHIFGSQFYPWVSPMMWAAHKATFRGLLMVIEGGKKQLGLKEIKMVEEWKKI